MPPTHCHACLCHAQALPCVINYHSLSKHFCFGRSTFKYVLPQMKWTTSIHYYAPIKVYKVLWSVFGITKSSKITSFLSTILERDNIRILYTTSFHVAMLVGLAHKLSAFSMPHQSISAESKLQFNILNPIFNSHLKVWTKLND